MKKDFILMEAGAGLMKYKLPDAYEQEEHYNNAERLSRRIGFGMGGIVLDILEPMQKIVNKILNDSNVFSREQGYSIFTENFANKLQQEFNYNNAHKYSNNNKFTM